MSVNGSDQFMSNAPANVGLINGNINGYRNMIIYDICQNKYFLICTSETQLPLQKEISTSTIGDNFSTNSNNGALSESSFSNTMTKDVQFSDSSQKRAVNQNTSSNFVPAKNQHENTDSTLKHARFNQKTITPTYPKAYTCDDCQEVFDKNYLRALHKCTASESFECEFCMMSFPNAYTLNRHKPIHRGEKAYEDSLLEKLRSFKNRLSAVRGSALIKKDTGFVCDDCKKMFESNHHLSLHNCTALKSFECESCKVRFHNAYALNKHNRILHTSEKPLEEISGNKIGALEEGAVSNKDSSTPTQAQAFTCNVCQKVFDKLYLRTLHKCIQRKYFECEFCKRKCPDNSSLIRHKRTHTGEKPYSCSVCNKKFADSSGVYKHRRIHTGEKPFVCDICDKRFGRRSILRKHINAIHINKKPPKVKKQHICNFCQKVFTFRKHLYSHFRTHTGEKPYECDICRKRFSAKTGFHQHQKIHTGEKLYVCVVCNSRFSQNSSLQTHIKDIHEGNDAYLCHFCCKSFAKKRLLLRHYRTHTGENPYVCSICHEEFSRQKDLREHQLIHYDEVLK